MDGWSEREFTRSKLPIIKLITLRCGWFYIPHPYLHHVDPYSDVSHEIEHYQQLLRQEHRQYSVATGSYYNTFTRVVRQVTRWRGGGVKEEDEEEEGLQPGIVLQSGGLARRMV